MQAQSWLFDLVDALQLHLKYASEDRVLDALYNAVDDLFLQGRFDEVDQLLEDLISLEELQDFDKTLLLGIATITLSAHNHLPSRDNFLKQLDKIWEADPEREVLLKGLWR